jgi:hypothetical protein
MFISLDFFKLVYRAIETYAGDRGNGCCISHRDMIFTVKAFVSKPLNANLHPRNLGRTMAAVNFW